MGGWILLWRQLRDHPFWRGRRRFSKAEAWLDLLMDAAFEDHDVLLGSTLVHVKRGQALISQRAKAKLWGWARNTVHSFVALLEKLEMISHEVSRGPDGGHTLLTITNYGKFQNTTEPPESHQFEPQSKPRTEPPLSHDLSIQKEGIKKGKRKELLLPGSFRGNGHRPWPSPEALSNSITPPSHQVTPASPS